MSLTRAVAWNTGFQLAGKLISTALGVVIVGLMTRYLGQAGFGAYSTANAFLQIFALLLDLGLNVTLIAMLGEHAGNKPYENRIVSALFTLRLIMAIVILGLFAPAIAWLFPYSVELKLAILALTGSFILPAINQIAIGVQQRHLKTHLAAVGEVIGRIVLLVGLLIAISQSWGLVPIVFLVSLGSLGNFLLCFLATRRYADFRWNWDPAMWRIALKKSWPIGVAIAFNVLYYKADTLVLSLVRPQAEVGIYGAAYRVLEILITVPFIYAGLVLPILSKAWAEHDKERFARLLSRSFDLMMLMITPLVAGTLIIGTRLMTLVAGPDFVQAGDILRILVIAVGMVYLNTVFSHAVVAANAQRVMLPINITVALVTLVGYIIFIPSYGLWAAAWLTVFSETAILIGSWLVAHSRAPFRIHVATPLAAITAALLMALIIWPLRQAWLGWPILIGAVCYAAAAILLGGVDKETLKEILLAKKGLPQPPTNIEKII